MRFYSEKEQIAQNQKDFGIAFLKKGGNFLFCTMRGELKCVCICA
jgi:hypothetical protein